MANEQSNESIEELREELRDARAELERIYEDRRDFPSRIAHFGPMHGEDIRRLQITTAKDGDILSVVQQGELLWLEVMRLRGRHGGHDMSSLYLSADEARSLRNLLNQFLDASLSHKPD